VAIGVGVGVAIGVGVGVAIGVGVGVAVGVGVPLDICAFADNARQTNASDTSGMRRKPRRQSDRLIEFLAGRVIVLFGFIF
jgi:hypothetical protein